MDKIIRDSIFTGIAKVVHVGMVLVVCSAVAAGQDRVALDETNSMVYNGVRVTQDAARSPVLNTIISIHAKDVPLLEAVKEIAAKSELEMVYNSKLLAKKDRPITIHLAQVTVEKALWSALEGTGLRFAVSANKQLVLLERRGAKDSRQRRSAKVQETITGTVTDAQSGETLPGVNILVKGTSTGASTDADGQYELEVESLQDTLVVSFVGYKTQQVPINGRTEINIQMQPQAITGEEMVVVGYGSVKNENVTGSISQISGQSLSERSNTTLGESLTGQAAGVRAQQLSGQPGQEFKITVRGSNSINSSNSPLYVVDGVPQSGIKDLDPNNIKSVEILKDASSAAIYGARGANGVVIITTKTGKNEKVNFEFNANYGIQKVDGYYPVMDRNHFLAYNIWARNYKYLAQQGGNLNDPMSMRPERTQIPENWRKDPESLSSTDWQSLIYRLAPQQDYNLSVSGGGDQGTFFISGSYMNQKGILITTNYKRFNLRANSTLNVGENLQFGLNIAPSFSIRSPYRSVGRPIHIAAVLPPVVPVDANTEETGYTPGVINYINPVKKLKETPRQQRVNRIRSNAWGKVDITNNLTFRSQFSFFHGENSFSVFSPPNVNRGAPATGTASDSKGYQTSVQNTLKYRPALNSWLDLNLLLGQSVERSKDYEISTSATGYPNVLVSTLNVASKPIGASTSLTENHLLSFFGRLKLNFSDKYLLTLNARRDGSSRFGSDTKWGWFPSASFAWKINEESFMQNMEWLDLLKLRLMAGVAGNDRIGNYEHIALLGQANYNFGGNLVSGLAPTTLGNPALSWETTYSKGIGLNFSVLDDRLTTSVDYYIENTKNMLLNSQLSFLTGQNSVRLNLGEVRNRGWELQLTSHNIRSRSIDWITKINLSHNSNEVTKLGIGNTPIINSYYGSRAFITKVGEPMGSFYMYKTDGLLMKEDFDKNGNPLVPVAPGQIPGNIQIVDKNEDGEINTKDYTVVGNNRPNLLFGINNRFSYKNFGLNILINGQLGGQLWNLGYRYYDSGSDLFNSLKHWTHSYRPPAPNGQDPFPKNPILAKIDHSFDGHSYVRFGNNPSFSDEHLFSATYLRIKNISLTYKLPESFCKQINFKRIKVSLIADNLLTWDNYIGPSPTFGNYGNSTTTPGIEYSTYALARTYSLGINLKF